MATESTFADRLKALREKSGMSVFQLTLAAGIQEQNIRLWERGPRKPSDPDHIAALAKALGTTTDYLITGDEATAKSEAA